MLNSILLLQYSTINNEEPYYYCGDICPEVSIFRRGPAAIIDESAIIYEPAETDDYCVSIYNCIIIIIIQIDFLNNLICKITLP